MQAAFPPKQGWDGGAERDARSHPPVMCSQALPAMGRTMRPRKAWFTPDVSLTSSIAPVRYLGAQVVRYK